ncbi:MAG: PEP-CTERM sorting domain-containing protein [Planctomycetales bacterium]|nr:PEP-CTERM sorting domain-containing protein [Planctomycetales bacterium]
MSVRRGTSCKLSLFQRLSRVTAMALMTTGLLSGVASTGSAQTLLGYWMFEESDIGDDAVDSSENGLNGIYEGDVVLGVEGAPGFGNGAEFDGATAQVLIGPGDENGLGELTESFTVMAWIYPTQFSHKNRVMGGSPVGGGWGWGTVQDSLEITTYGVKDYDQPVPLDLDTWTHAAIVLDADFQANFYVNGEYIGTQSHPAPGNPVGNNWYIGASCCAGEFFEGKLDEVGVFEGELTEEQIKNAMNFGVSNYNGKVDNPRARLDDGTLTDPIERRNYVHDVLKTWIGDSNFDGEFDSSDFVLVFTAGQYEDGVAGNSTWVTGDWDGDHEFGSSDFVAAFADGGFEQGPVAAVSAVPEPSSLVLLAIGGLLAVRRRSRV